MSHKRSQETDTSRPMVYQIRIKGHLGREWTDWFGGLTITLEDNGDTLLTGPVVDQAALHGLLRKVRDLGMPLLSVTRVNPNQADGSDVERLIIGCLGPVTRLFLPFRPRFSRPEAIGAWVREAGFARLSHDETKLWHTEVYVRAR